MFKKQISVEWRYPRTKLEKKVMGLSVIKDSSAKVFINTKRCRNSEELVKTFWHEMAHVFFAFHGHEPKIEDLLEETMCEDIESAVYPIIHDLKRRLS